MNYFAIPGLRRELEPNPIHREPNDIIFAVARSCGYSYDEIMKLNRRRRRVAARHIAMVAVRQSGLSLNEVGALFAKDHTTIMHAEKKLSDMLEVGDELYTSFVKRLESKEDIDLTLFRKHYKVNG